MTDDVESGVHDAVEMEKEEQLEPSESRPATPADPHRGLPQMCRSRLSSEMSEEGGDGGSRRDSISDAPGLVPNHGVSEPAGGVSEPASGVSHSARADNDGAKSLIDEGGVSPGKSPDDMPVNASSLIQSKTGSARETVDAAATCEPGEVPTNTSSNLTSGVDSLTRPSAMKGDVGDGSETVEQSSSSSSSRPPPLKISEVPAEPAGIVSPPLLVASPGVSGAGSSSTLPLLSPLSATPTRPNPPSLKLTSISTATASGITTNLPQLMPTNTTAKPSDTVVQSLSSEMLNLGSGTEEIGAEEKSALFSNDQLHTATSADGVSVTPSTVTSAQHSLSPSTAERNRESFEEPRAPLTGKTTEHTRQEEGERESVLSDIDTPSPEETQRESGKTRDPAEETPPTISAHTPPTKGDSAQSPNKDDENDSIISSVSSKNSPEPSPTRQEPENEAGFSLEQVAVSDERARLMAREVAVDDINTEGGGEGGVACILDEGEMALPDIDQQLQLSDSEETSSSGSSSGSEVNPLSEAEEKGSGPMFLEPPAAGFHRSSHSVASTPSVSPSPSPVPESGTSHHSIPIPKRESLTPEPHAKPSPSVVPKEEVVTQVQGSLSRPKIAESAVAAPLVVSFRTELIPSLCDLAAVATAVGGGRGRGRGRGRGGGGGRGRGGGEKKAKEKGVGSKWRKKPQVSRGAQPNESPEKKKQKLTAMAQRVKTEPQPTPLPLVISIPRSFLHYELPGVMTSDPQPVYEDDDDDIIVTHSSAEQLKLEPSPERFKVDATLSKLQSYPRRGSQYLAPEGPAVGVSGGQGVWRRELDISEMGLVGSLPLPEPQQVSQCHPEPVWFLCILP